MKTILTATVMAIIIIGGCQSGPVKSDCVCPPVQILMNTEAGLLHFEPGELDLDVPYILRGDQVEEFKRQIEKENLKANGKGA